MLLIFDRKVEIRCPTQLDFSFQTKTYHGNYQAVRSFERAVELVCKHGHYITDLPNLIEAKLVTLKEMIIRDVKQLGLEKAFIQYSENLPNKTFTGVSLVNAHKHLKKQEQLKHAIQADEVSTPFPLKDFHFTQQLAAWIDNPDKTLLLVGHSGVGKTAFCKAFIREKNLKALLVNHRQDFRRLNNSHDAVLLDDASILGLSATELLAFIDNKVGKTLRVFYSTVFQNKNLVQMVAMNHPEFEKLYPTIGEDRFARRILFQEVNEPFIKCLNFNIQMNQVNQVNNTTNFNDSKLKEEKHIADTLASMHQCYSKKRRRSSRKD